MYCTAVQLYNVQVEKKVEINILPARQGSGLRVRVEAGLALLHSPLTANYTLRTKPKWRRGQKQDVGKNTTVCIETK